MKIKKSVLVPVLFSFFAIYAQEKKNSVVPNENLIAENIAEIPKELAHQVKKYSEARGASLAEIHPTKKVKFYCKNDKQMFCSKCILKHTEMKHDVIPISPKIEEMKKLIEEMVLEVEKHD